MKLELGVVVLTVSLLFGCTPLEQEETTIDEIQQQLGEGNDDGSATSASRLGQGEMPGPIVAVTYCEEGSLWIDGSNGQTKDGLFQDGECPVADSPGSLNPDELGDTDDNTYNLTAAWTFIMHKKLVEAKSAADLQKLADATKKTYHSITVSPDYAAAITAGSAKATAVVGPSTAARIQRLRMFIVLNDTMQMAIRARAKDLGVPVIF